MGSPFGDAVVTRRVCTSPASREGDLHGGALPAAPAPALSAQVWRGVAQGRAGSGACPPGLSQGAAGSEAVPGLVLPSSAHCGEGVWRAGGCDLVNGHRPPLPVWWESCPSHPPPLTLWGVWTW